MALAIAAWIKYVTGIDLNGETIDVRDPLEMILPLIAKSKQVRITLTLFWIKVKFSRKFEG